MPQGPLAPAPAPALGLLVDPGGQLVRVDMLLGLLELTQHRLLGQLGRKGVVPAVLCLEDLWGLRGDQVLPHAAVQQRAGEPNVDGRLQLVAGQHPDLS